jgi:hypothetical protein
MSRLCAKATKAVVDAGQKKLRNEVGGVLILQYRRRNRLHGGEGEEGSGLPKRNQ